MLASYIANHSKINKSDIQQKIYTECHYSLGASLSILIGLRSSPCQLGHRLLGCMGSGCYSTTWPTHKLGHMEHIAPDLRFLLGLREEIWPFLAKRFKSRQENPWWTPTWLPARFPQAVSSSNLLWCWTLVGIHLSTILSNPGDVNVCTKKKS